MGMVKKEGARYWCGKTKLGAGRNARKISTARTFDTIHKEYSTPPRRHSRRKGKAGKFPNTGKRDTKNGQTRELRCIETGEMQNVLEEKRCWRKKENAKRDPKGSFQPTNNKVQDLTERSRNILGHREAMFRPSVVSESGEGKPEAV